MKCYAVIGHPVAHSLSPVIHAWFAAQTGEDIQYEHLNATATDFESAVQQFQATGGRGLNVTVPHKEAAVRLAGRVMPHAQTAGAANWLRFGKDGIIADNTDGRGLVRDLTEVLGIDLSGMDVLLLGAGGAARGVVGPLLEPGLNSLTVANRTPGRAEVLVESHGTRPGLDACGLDGLGGVAFDLILNATATGLSDFPMDLPPSILDLKRTICYDLGYGGESGFLKWARQSGCTRVFDGLGMLVEQAAESFDLWHGVRPETAPVRDRLRSAVMRRTG